MQNDLLVCPNCGNYVAVGMPNCPYCGRALTNVGYSNQGSVPPPQQVNTPAPNFNPNPNSNAQMEVPVSQPPTSKKVQDSKTSGSSAVEPLSLAGFLLGLLSLIAQWGGLLGSVAIVTAALALNKHVRGKDKALAIAGIILGVVSLVCLIVELIYLGHTLSSFTHLLNSLRNGIQQLINH